MMTVNYFAHLSVQEVKAFRPRLYRYFIGASQNLKRSSFWHFDFETSFGTQKQPFFAVLRQFQNCAKNARFWECIIIVLKR
jgi:hypothetical protein